MPRNGIANFNNIVALNSIVETYHDGHHVFYLDVFNDFASDVWGSKFRSLIYFLIFNVVNYCFTAVNGNYFWDGLHLSEAGYQRWAELMNPLFNQLIQ